MDPEVPGSSPEWVPVFYEARSIAQILPSLHPFGVVHRYTRAAVTGAFKLNDGCSQKLSSATLSGASSGKCHINKVKINCMTLSRWLRHEIVSVTLRG